MGTHGVGENARPFAAVAADLAGFSTLLRIVMQRAPSGAAAGPRQRARLECRLRLCIGIVVFGFFREPSNQEIEMRVQNSASPRRLAAGAVLLILAATASGCGVGLPTQPELSAGAVVERNDATTQTLDEEGSLEFGDATPPTGGPDQTNKPPAGEEVIQTPGPGNSSWGLSHRKPKN